MLEDGLTLVTEHVTFGGLVRVAMNLGQLAKEAQPGAFFVGIHSASFKRGSADGLAVETRHSPHGKARLEFGRHFLNLIVVTGFYLRARKADKRRMAEEG
jgi:hypothetical protein